MTRTNSNGLPRRDAAHQTMNGESASLICLGVRRDVKIPATIRLSNTSVQFSFGVQILRA